MRTRIAPSPTGYIHVGNTRTALLCYLYAKKKGGEFMLRIDDTDTERSTEECKEAAKEDFTWLGLKWDVTANQSDRFDVYNEAVEKLKADGRVYACYETEEELDIKRKMQRSRGLPPVYDRAALKLTDAEISAYEAEGRKPHYRFKIADSEMTWEDEVRGHVSFQPGHVSDPIIIRENGMYTYMLPSVIDDADFNITHVLRGEDHISNTAVQLQMFEALGKPLPTFAHMSLMTVKDGKMSKREGGFSIRDLREHGGYEPLAILSFLARIGTSDDIALAESLDELVEKFDITKFSKSATQYNEEEIARLNKILIHQMPYAQAKSRVGDADEAFWNTVRGNLGKVEDAKEWWNMCHGNVEPVIEDKDYIQTAASLLPEEWGENTWDVWISAIKEKTGRKGKELFMPLRQALTAMNHGPEMGKLLPLIPRDVAKKRLSA